MKAWEANVRTVVPYTPGEQPNRPGMIKLNTNENPYPPAPGVLKALEEPVRQIAANGGLEGSVIIDTIRRSGKAGYGFDAYKEEYCDMIPAGIVDPTKVTRSALQNAASIAGMVLTTESLVADKKEPTPPAPPMGDPTGGMGGMY